jgi:ribokinase
MSNSEQLDFLAIGDITTDNFIELDDVRIDTDPDEGDNGSNEICFRFGDKVEYRDLKVVHAVGNSPNAAVSATRLGLQTALDTNLGNDENGDACRATLAAEGVSTDCIRVHEGKKTNSHFVLRYQAERTILVKHWEYPYQLPELGVAPRWMYLSSMGESSLAYHHTLAGYIKENNVKLAFQPGTFQMKLGYEELKDVYEASELFFCNKEEAQRILGVNENNIPELMKIMRERGPHIVVITDGPNGAYAYDGQQAWQMPMYPDPKPPVDRTGAGDAFSSTFTSAIALGYDIPTALAWGPINSMSVVQYIGAQEGLLSRAKLEEYLTQAPDDYKPTQISF